MSLKYKYYITTSDKVMWSLKECSHSFNHFCDAKIRPTVLGYEKPEFELPENFEFLSMGKDRGITYWAEDLYNAFSNIDEDFIIWGLDDYEYQKRFELDVINDICQNHLNENTNWFGLSDGPAKRSHELVKDYGDFQVIKLKQDAEYRVTCQVNIWNRKRLVHYLRVAAMSNQRVLSYPPGSPWYFEVLCSQLAKNDGYDVYAFKNIVPVHYRGLNYTVQNESIQPNRIKVPFNKDKK